MNALSTDSMRTMSRALPYKQMAERVKQQHAGKMALLVDLSAVSNIHNRIVFRSITRFIEERMIGEPIDAMPLARNILVLLAPQKSAQQLADQLMNFGSQLQQQNYGSLRLRIFDMENQSSQFIETTRQLMEQAPALQTDREIDMRDPAAPDLKSLAHVIDTHRVLWQADISNQSRRQTIWQLETDISPKVLADEIWVSIAAIERITGITLHDKMWLFDKTTELLDHRVIAQLMAETRSLTRPTSVNMHLTTVIDAGFRRLLDDKPAAQLRQLIIEIPYAEWRLGADLRDKALQVLRQHGIRLCLDGINPQEAKTLTEADWENAHFLKLDAAAHAFGAQASALHHLANTWRTQMKDKAILCHCDTAAVVEAGIGAGIRFFQGRGLPALLDDVKTMSRLLGVKSADGAAAALKGIENRPKKK